MDFDSPIHFIQNGDELEILRPSKIKPHSSFLSGDSHRLFSLDDFDLLKVIGKGGFSKVFMVRRRDTGKVYALKTLSKDKIRRDNKVENIMNERAIMEGVNHPFIVRMKQAFQNDEFLFLVLEFCPGGELFFKLTNIP